MGSNKSLNFLGSAPEEQPQTLVGLAKPDPNANDYFFFTRSRNCSTWERINEDDLVSLRKLGVDVCSDGNYYHLVQIKLKNAAIQNGVKERLMATRAVSAPTE